jgi:hypothetical protein
MEPPNEDDGDDEIMFIEEIQGEVSLLVVRVKAEQPNELIILEDEENSGKVRETTQGVPSVSVAYSWVS